MHKKWSCKWYFKLKVRQSQIELNIGIFVLNALWLYGKNIHSAFPNIHNMMNKNGV